jgi:hypothetical protein
MPLQATSGAASYDAFGGGVPVVPAYIEEVFSTYLWTGDGTTSRTITNGIDLAGKGGLVFIKNRSSGTDSWGWFDTARGVINGLSSNLTNAQLTYTGLASTSATGFVTSSDSADYYGQNTTGANVASWTFRKQPKFFDVLTYTGNGTAGRTISHNLGSTPGCIFIKKTSSASTNGWPVYHRSGTDTFFLNQNDNEGGLVSNVVYSPTDTTFTVSSYTDANASGQTYVAYLFAHDAGGFGLAGTDNVISCGGFTTDGSGNATVSLGYEPQFIIVKSRGTNGDWRIFDVMRGMPVGNTNVARLVANTTSSETLTSDFNVSPTSTGFIGKFSTSTNATYVYIAIRRGPMKVPTSGTSVFSPNAVTMTASGSATITTNFPVDLSFNRRRSSADQYAMDRLRGGSQTFYNYLRTQTTGAETTGSSIGVGFDNNTALVDNNWQSGVSSNTIWWSFRRAPSFFDQVCYTGTGSVTTQTHNLGVAPELLIVKRRDSANYAPVWSKSIGDDYILKLFDIQANSDDPKDGPTDVQFNQTAPTASVFTLGTSSSTNGSGATYVAWMWATCAGVSKVGSYTGTGAAQTINCGFAAGSRFVLIKRTDSTGDWYVWDSARGIIPANDPYLLLNSTAAEVTGTDYIDTTSVGFDITSTAPAAINANGGTFIFLAIA